MNYKDIDFTIENAEKYPDAEIICECGKNIEWSLSKDERSVFTDVNGKWNRTPIGHALTHFKLRIPVEYRKERMFTLPNGFGLVPTGYSIHIDENGNPVGEPFKTEP